MMKKVENKSKKKLCIKLNKIVAEMVKDKSILKEPKFFKDLRTIYSKLLIKKLTESENNTFSSGLLDRLKFYKTILIDLNVKYQGGAFLDTYFAGSDIGDYYKFLQYELQIIRKNNFLEANNSDVWDIFIEIFSLSSISSELRLNILNFFKNSIPNKKLQEKIKKIAAYFLANKSYKTGETLEYLLILIRYADTQEEMRRALDQALFPLLNSEPDIFDEVRCDFSQKIEKGFFYKIFSEFKSKNNIEVILTFFLSCLNSSKTNRYAQVVGLFALHFLSKYFSNNLTEEKIRLIYNEIYHLCFEHTLEEPSSLMLSDISEMLIKNLLRFGILNKLTNIQQYEALELIALKSENEYFLCKILDEMKKIQSIILNDFVKTAKSNDLEKKLNQLLNDQLTLTDTKETIRSFLKLEEGDLSFEDYKDSSSEEDDLSFEDFNPEKITKLFSQKYMNFNPKYDDYYEFKHIFYEFYKPSSQLTTTQTFRNFLVNIQIKPNTLRPIHDLAEFLIFNFKLTPNASSTGNAWHLFYEVFQKSPLILRFFLYQSIISFNKKYSILSDEQISNLNAQETCIPETTLELNEKFGDCKDLSYYVMLGLIYKKNGNDQAALRSFRKAEQFEYGNSLPLYQRALIYKKNGDIIAAFEVLKLAQEAIYFNLEISELMCEIFEDLGWFQDAIKDYESIKQKLPFYEKNFASFFSKINFSSISHPYKNDLSSILDKIRALDDNPTTEEIISLIEWIESTFTILNISPDQLHYCKIVFELEKKLTLESYVYPNEKKRLIIDYFAFVLEQTIRVEQMFCFGDIVLKKEKEKDLVSFVDESKICDIYEEVFNNTINISDLLILFQENGVEALSTIEFVNRYSDNENLKDGYLLGYSEDIANTYTLFCMLYGLVRWETAYKEHEIVMNQSSSHTNFFLNKISSENKKIVFLVPINVGNYMNKSNVTYKELKWLLKSIKGKNPQVKEFILVFDTYNYFPYYLFSKINYLHTHGTYLLFNQGIDKKMSEFDKKMAFAVTAAKHLLSKVISDVKLECAIRIFNENLSTYVERNIKSTYWPILEITRQYDDKIKAKQYQEECNRVLTSFFEYSDFDLFFKEVFLPTLNKKEDDIEYIKCFRSTFTEIMEDSDFICYFFYIKKFKTENYDAMFKLVKDVDDSYEESKFTDDDENSEESLASFSSKSALTMSVEKESAQKENLKNEKKTVYTMAKHKKYDWVPDDPRKYNDNDITDYKELIIKHKLGGFKSIPESNAYQFLLSQKFIDQNDENKEYFVAVTDSVDTVGANLPIDCFLDKTHQVRSPIAIALSTIIPILNNLNQDQDDVLQKQLKEYLPDGDYDDEFRENILEKLKEVNFDRESLQRMVQEAEKIFQIRDVFEELIPEMLKTDICYAKIVFPYNKTNVHWLSGEIKVAKNSHDYAIEVYAHDPYGGGQMAADNFNTLQETVERRIRAEDPQATVTCTNKVSPYKKGRQIEEDAISCGIITAEDIIKLMQCHSLDMEAPYQYGSLNLREKHCGEFATYASNTITNERFIQRFNAAKQAIGPQQQILPVIIQKPEDSMDELSSNEKHQLVELISTLKNEDLKNGITHAITNTEFYDAKDGSYFLLVRSAIEDIPVLLRSRGMEIDEEDVKAINQIHKILFKKYIAEDVIYNVGLMLIAERSKSCASQSRDSGESIQSKSSSITRYSFHSTASTTRSDENIMRTKTKPYLPRNFTF